jgi:hypothetical protein
MADGDRRGSSSAFTLTRGLAVEIVIGFGGDQELVVPASVEAMTDRTVRIRVPDGPLGLAVGMSPHCTVVVTGDSHFQAVHARPGRRIDDVRSPTLLELVLDEPAIALATEPEPAPTA